MSQLIIKQKPEQLFVHSETKETPPQITTLQKIIFWILKVLSCGLYQPKPQEHQPKPQVERSFYRELSDLPLGSSLMENLSDPTLLQLEQACNKIINNEENPPFQTVYFNLSLKEKITISAALAKHLAQIHDSPAKCHGDIKMSSAIYIQDLSKEKPEFIKIAWMNLQETNHRKGTAQEDIASFGDCLIILFTSDQYQSLESPTIEDLEKDLKNNQPICEIIIRMTHFEPTERPTALWVQTQFEALLEQIGQ